MQKTADFIKKIYPNSPKPLYLSQLGGILKKNGLMIGNLREFVESMDGYTVACGPEKERTAIATIDDKEEIEKILHESANKLDSEALHFLTKIPRTLLFAFASKCKAQPNVYFTTSPPYRFTFAKEDDSMVEIENDYLIDAKIPINLKQMEQSVITQIFTNIKKWSEKNKIDLSMFEKHIDKSFAGDKSTLLEEIIQAIPANKRSKVVLPLDIISYLIKKR
nr:hypothetical protein [Desulfobulbaceae bacterium]